MARSRAWAGSQRRPGDGGSHDGHSGERSEPRTGRSETRRRAPVLSLHGVVVHHAPVLPRYLPSTRRHRRSAVVVAMALSLLGGAGGGIDEALAEDHPVVAQATPGGRGAGSSMEASAVARRDAERARAVVAQSRSLERERVASVAAALLERERAEQQRLEEERVAAESAAVEALVPGCAGLPVTAAGENGRLETGGLCRLWVDEVLRPDAAVALARLDLAFRARFGTDLPVTDGYRDYASQAALRRQKPGLAAPAGTSQHGWGTAVDLGGAVGDAGDQYWWLREHAPALGWDNPEWAREGGGGAYEPWHWEFTPPA